MMAVVYVSSSDNLTFLIHYSIEYIRTTHTHTQTSDKRLKIIKEQTEKLLQAHLKIKMRRF